MTTTKRYQIAAISLAFLTVMFVATAAEAQPGRAAAMDAAEKERRRLAALTLPEAAKAAGEHYVRPMMSAGSWAVASSLEDLTKFSDLVIVGDSVSGHASLSTDKMYIQTTFVVRVVEAIKGQLPIGSAVRVSIPGGRMSFSDGSSAETVTAQNGLESGRRYVLFLESIEKKTPEFLLAPHTRGAYRTVLGRQGTFELRTDGIVAGGRSIDPVAYQNDRMSVASFLAKVRRAMRAVQNSK